MKRYLLGLTISFVLVGLAFAIIYNFGEYERVSFMIISFLLGIIGQFIADEIASNLFPKKKDFRDSSVEDYTNGYDSGFEAGYDVTMKQIKD